MVKHITKVKLSLFLKKELANTILNELRMEIIQEDQSGELEERSFGHSLSNSQLNRLNARVSNSKKALTVGQLLRKLASERGFYSYNEKKFREPQITKTYWSRLLNDKYKVHDKDKLIRISLFFKLSLKETMELLYKAGLTLSAENAKDEIITFCLEENIYDLSDIDELLKDNNLPTMFSKIRSIEE